jgi:cytochrome c556
MIRSRNLVVLALSLAFVMVLVGTSDMLANSGALNKDVAARMTLMSSMGRNMGVLGKMLQKKAPFDQGRAVEAITNIEQLAVETPTVFENKVLDPRSEAKELIWEEFKSFTKISTGLAASAKQLPNSMKSFDDLRPALIALSQSCKECHSRFLE